MIINFIIAFSTWFNTYQNVDFALDKGRSFIDFLQCEYPDFKKDIADSALKATVLAFSEKRYPAATANADLTYEIYKSVLQKHQKQHQFGSESLVRDVFLGPKYIADDCQNVCLTALIMAITLRIESDNVNAFSWANKAYLYFNEYLESWEETEVWKLLRENIDMSGSTFPVTYNLTTEDYNTLRTKENTMMQKFCEFYREFFSGIPC